MKVPPSERQNNLFDLFKSASVGKVEGGGDMVVTIARGLGGHGFKSGNINWKKRINNCKLKY